MNQLKFYGYKKCSTCAKAERFLKQSNFAYEFVDITIRPPSEKELEAMLKAKNGDFKQLFNTSGQVYREQKIAAKLPSLSQGQIIKLLAENGRLVKRPFLLSENEGLLGFKEQEWKSKLKNLR